MKLPNTYGIKEVKLTILREEPLAAPCVVSSPEEMLPILEAITKNHPYFNPEIEQFMVFFLNTRNKITGWQLCATGMLDAVYIHPREVFKAAIVGNAHSIIVVHNHPSGDPTPSEADIKITRELIRAGQLLKLEVRDHIIFAFEFTKMKLTSLRSLGYFYS
jgi:DNA repair protein RadC